MSTFHGHVVSEAVQVPDASETTADLLTGDTVIPVAHIGDFTEGTHVRIDGTVYAYDDELSDDGEDSGIPSITLDSPGLLADVAEGTTVESWNPNANGGVGEVISEWQALVVNDGDSDGIPAPASLLHTLVPMLPANMPLTVGDSVTVEKDPDGSWLILNVLGATPGYDPGYIKTGTLSATTTIIAGDETGKRVQMDGVDPAFEAFDASNVQTVNIDGQDNYMVGVLATAASGPRVEVGEGPEFSGVAEEVRLYSGMAGEVTPAQLTVFDIGHGIETKLEATEWLGATGVRGTLLLLSGDSANASDARLVADTVNLIASNGATSITSSAGTTINGGLSAVMTTGGVGFGAFRDTVDARVTAVASPTSAAAFAFFMGA